MYLIGCVAISLVHASRSGPSGQGRTCGELNGLIFWLRYNFYDHMSFLSTLLFHPDLGLILTELCWFVHPAGVYFVHMAVYFPPVCWCVFVCEQGGHVVVFVYNGEVLWAPVSRGSRCYDWRHAQSAQHNSDDSQHIQILQHKRAPYLTVC